MKDSLKKALYDLDTISKLKVGEQLNTLGEHLNIEEEALLKDFWRT